MNQLYKSAAEQLGAAAIALINQPSDIHVSLKDLGFIAQEAFHNARLVRVERFAQLKRIVKLVPKVCYVVCHDDDGNNDLRYTADKVGSKEVLESVRLSLKRGYAEVEEITSFDDVKECVTGWSQYATAMYSEADYRQMKADKQRRKLERRASEIARSANCSVDSMDFIKACEKVQQSEAYTREALREDGACSGFGCTYDNWSEDYSYSQSLSNEIDEILEWISSECPLLWMQYQESKRKDQ